jgi:hypothetical protein
MTRKKLPIRARFANESTETIIRINKEAFKPEREFNEEIFGWIDGSYIAVNKEDWKAANEIWGKEEIWDLTVISKSSKGLLVYSPNGDAQWMSQEEYDNAIKKRKERHDRSN